MIIVSTGHILNTVPYRTEVTLPNDIWKVILNAIKEDAKAKKQFDRVPMSFHFGKDNEFNAIKEDAKAKKQFARVPMVPMSFHFGKDNEFKYSLQVRLVFLSSVSKQLSSLCKVLKQTNKEDKQPKSTDFTRYFARNGYLTCLVYAHENGCQWDRLTCSDAALNGHLECLKYAHKNGCQWDRLTCSYAAKKGHLGCLKYAHENGCPWNADTCYYADSQGHLECLKYAHENGCPCQHQA